MNSSQQAYGGQALQQLHQLHHASSLPFTGFSVLVLLVVALGLVAIGAAVRSIRS